MAQALRHLAEALSQPGGVTTHVKTLRVELDAASATTTQVIELRGASRRGWVEQHAVWHCQWSVEPDVAPRLRQIRVESFEEVFSSRHDALFRDATPAVLGQLPAYRGQLSRGLNDWLSRIETIHGMYVFAEYGIAIGDANGDGLDDVYVCQPGGLPNRLLLRAADGTVTDQSAAAGVDWLDHTSSALLVDLDNDGDQDLALAVESRRVLVMQNDGEGHFELAAELPIDDRHVQGLSSADYDNDGDLDLYLTVGFADQRARPDESRPEFVYHDANEGGANVLFRNDSVADQPEVHGRNAASRTGCPQPASQPGRGLGRLRQRRRPGSVRGQRLRPKLPLSQPRRSVYRGRRRRECGRLRFRDVGQLVRLRSRWEHGPVCGQHVFLGWQPHHQPSRPSSLVRQRQRAQLLGRFAKGNTLFRNDGQRRLRGRGRDGGRRTRAVGMELSVCRPE